MWIGSPGLRWLYKPQDPGHNLGEAEQGRKESLSSPGCPSPIRDTIPGPAYLPFLRNHYAVGGSRTQLSFINPRNPTLFWNKTAGKILVPRSLASSPNSEGRTLAPRAHWGKKKGTSPNKSTLPNPPPETLPYSSPAATELPPYPYFPSSSPHPPNSSLPNSQLLLYTSPYSHLSTLLLPPPTSSPNTQPPLLTPTLSPSWIL